jgi:hypothetical protein
MRVCDIMTADESIVADYARSLSKNELIIELIDRGNYAMADPNIGTFKVVSILIAELQARGPLSPMLSDFKQAIDEGITVTLADLVARGPGG